MSILYKWVILSVLQISIFLQHVFFAFKSAVNPRKYVDTLYYRLSQFYNYCKYNFVFKFDTFPINALALTCMFLILCCSPWR